MGPDHPASEPGRPRTDWLTSVLENRRQRRLLYCLVANGDPMSLSDVAHQLAVWEGAHGDDYRRELRDVYDSLSREDVPDLCDLGVVTYDADEDRVALAAESDEVAGRLSPHFRAELDDLLRAEGEPPQSDA